MSIRLDPRRVNALKHLAGEAGLRPGDLVRHWVEERIDAARTGDAVPSAPGAESLLSRVDTLAARVAALEAATGAGGEPAERAEKPTRRRAKSKPVSAAPSGERVALHDEMIALITEHGPMTAADLAALITERGRYTPPRSGKKIDAAMVSQRVSNPTYRARFTRDGGRIGLAESS